MTVSRGLRRVAKVGVLALPVCLALTPGMALADTANVSATFQTQYQQNASTEAQLQNQVNSISSPTWQSQRLEFFVRMLNYRIQMYYQAEQRLAGILGSSGTVASPGSTSGSGTLSNLMSQRNQLLAQLMSAWQNLMNAVPAANSPGPGPGHGQDHGRHEGWFMGKGPKGPKGPKGLFPPKGPTIGSLQKMLTHNPNEVQNVVRQYLNSLKHKDGDGRFAQNGGANPNLTKVLGTVSQLLQQLAQVDDSIVNARHHQSKGDDDKNGSQRLANLQKRILSMQAEAIRELDKILTLNGQSPSTSSQSGTVTSLALSSSQSNVTEGASLTYTLQLMNSSNQPIHQAGVSVNFTLVNGHTDGSLPTASAVTNNNGQATVQIVAGNAVGTIQVEATESANASVDGLSPVVNVVAPTPAGATKLATSGSTFPTTLIMGQSTGTATDVLPETSAGTVVSGDTLQITTSNPSVLALPSPSSTNASVQTLQAGEYVLPAMTAKSAGQAVVTVTDVTSPQHPSVSFTVTVNQGSASQLVVINPNGSENTPFSVGAGVDGPFEIAVANSAGAVVPSPTTITLSALQVNQIIGAGTAIRPALSTNDVASVMIPAGQSSVSVYADNVAAGTTKPTTLSLASLAPSVTSATVSSNNTLVLTFSTGLNQQSAPSPADFSVSWNGGQQTPQSVAVSGDTVTITLWGTPIAHGDTVHVSYTAGSDANPLTSVFGVKAADFSNLSVSNPL